MAAVGAGAPLPGELVPAAVKVWDAFIFYDEMEILECRLAELDGSPVYRHVITEATRDLRGRPKPLFYGDNLERFGPWRDRIVHNVVTTLAPPEASPDPWTRDTAQRDAMMAGLAGAAPDDIVLSGDADEIPWPSVCGLVPPGGGHALGMRMCLLAADWLWPYTHYGTIASRLASIRSFSDLRRQREFLPRVEDAGWHLSWLGWPERVRSKIAVQCHLERSAETLEDLASGRLLRDGVWEDGTRLTPADVDGGWPRWVAERRCPGSWFRPRDGAGVA
jgi:beta-1,4-mannosyl-glycoprotein beta-1,4-N-acetylglucosaminyltransferase